MRRYHILEIVQHYSYKDKDGNYVTGKDKFKRWGWCYARFNSGGREIQTTDGTHLVYSVRIDAGNEYDDIKEGTQVRVLLGKKVLYEGNVLHFIRKQHGVTLWI